MSLFWHSSLKCLFPLVWLFSCLLPELKEEVLSSFPPLSLCFADVWQMRVVQNNVRYLKCWLGGFCASELEWFEFSLLPCLHIHYTLYLHTGSLFLSLTHTHTQTQVHYRHTHTHTSPWQCLEEPLLVTRQCKYFPIDLLWNISYSNYAT